jgi:hypothetical protein
MGLHVTILSAFQEGLLYNDKILMIQILLRIRGVPVWNLGPETKNPIVFQAFSQSLQEILE